MIPVAKKFDFLSEEKDTCIIVLLPRLSYSGCFLTHLVRVATAFAIGTDQEDFSGIN